MDLSADSYQEGFSAFLPLSFLQLGYMMQNRRIKE